MDLTVVTSRSELPQKLAKTLEQEGVSYVLSDPRPGALSRLETDYVLCGLPTDENGAAEAVAAAWRRRHDGELIIASRHHRGGRSMSRLANRLIRRVLDLPFDDVTGPLRLYRVAALRHVQLPDRESAVSRVELLVRLYNEGFKVKEIAAEGLSTAEPGLASVLTSLPRLRRLRTSTAAADYDDRAHVRGLKLRRRWLDRRQATIVSYLEVDVPVLDVGCGTSRLIQTLSKGVGLDNERKKLRFLRGRAKTIVGGDLRQLPFRDGSFPQLVCSDLGETAPSMDELKRILRPHGTLVIGTPDRASVRRRLLGSLAGLTAPARHDEPGLRNELEAAGFRVDEVRRVYGSEMIVRAVRR